MPNALSNAEPQALQPLRPLHQHMQYHRQHEDDSDHHVRDVAAEAHRHHADLQHDHDEEADIAADDRAGAAEDRGAADEDRGDDDQQRGLSLGGREVLGLHGQEHAGEAGERAHEREQLQPRRPDVDADYPRHGGVVADEQQRFAEAVAVEDEPQQHGDREDHHGLDRDAVGLAQHHAAAEEAREQAAGGHLPQLGLVEIAQRELFAAREEHGHAAPDEGGGERGDDRGDADTRHQHAVDEADERADAERGDDAEPAQLGLQRLDLLGRAPFRQPVQPEHVVEAVEGREDHARERDDRGKGQIDLAGCDDQREPERADDLRLVVDHDGD